MADAIEDLRFADHDAAQLQSLARKKLIAAIGESSEFITAWLSGSLVEGLGNKSSDVDIFVLVDELSQRIPATRRDSDHFTLAFVSDDVRYDVEFWPASRVQALAAKLSSVRLDDPEFNSNHYLSYWESEFVHRLAVGLPLVDESAFARTRAEFDLRNFSIYLFENCLRRFDDAFDDTVGMLADNQLACAALRAREVVGHSIDALLYASGITNDKTKFRIPKLQGLTRAFPKYVKYEQALWRFEAGLPGPGPEQRNYSEAALLFAADLIGELQDSLYRTHWKHVYDIGDHHHPRLASIL